MKGLIIFGIGMIINSSILLESSMIIKVLTLFFSMGIMSMGVALILQHLR